MRTILTIAAVATLALAPTAALAIDPPDDLGTAVLCIFTEPEATPTAENSLMNPDLLTPYTLYFVLYYPQAPSGFLGGVEFSLPIEPPLGDVATILELAFPAPYDALNIGEFPEIVAGFGEGAEVTSDHILICSLTLLFNADPGQHLTYLQPVANPSLPGAMAYNDFEDPGILLEMLPYSSDYTHANPVFGINSEVVAVENATWSGVKALFR